MKPGRTADLFEIVFSGRNKDYGGYLLRKRYPRYLIISTLVGVAFFAALAFGTFLYFSLIPSGQSGDEIVAMIDYYSVIPPPDNNMESLAGALPKTETTLAPVVTDSAVKEQIKPPETAPPEETREDSDTSGKGIGNVENGTGNGNVSGIVTVIDRYPKYPGGEDLRLWFLRKNIRYPETALKAGIQGVVILTFIIEKDGSLSDISVSKSIGGGCDEEALRVVRLMPKWEPALRNGQAVRVVVRMPVVFRVPGK
jgi:protein TonB